MKDVYEHWLSVVGFEGIYEVSDLGAVRSVTRTVTNAGKAVIIRGKTLRQKTIVDGYPRYVLIKDKKRHNVYLHRMVALAHVPNPNDFPIVMHRKQPKTNCSASNLEWGNHLLNQLQRKEDGTASIGEANGNAVLTDTDIFAIRSRRSNGEELSLIAKDYKVSKTLVSLICRGKAWAHVGGPINPAHKVNARRILTPEQIETIRKRRANGEKLVGLAKVWGVSHSTIYLVANGKNNRSITHV